MEGYSRLKLVGKGTFGSAYLVIRESDQIKYIEKEIRLSGLPKSEQDAAKKEVEMLRSLDHPNIVKYIDHKENAGTLHIIMEYADGGDLYAKLKRRGGKRMKEKSVMRYFTQICLALRHLHDKRILHRDLKTQNVFLTSSGVVKLGDFGISTILKNTFAVAHTVCGTPYYFSPELCQNKPYNKKSDVWSLGCILYELTTLNHAFDGPNMKALMQNIVTCTYSAIPSEYSEDLSGIISHMLSLDTTIRPEISQILSIPYVKSHNDALQLKYFSNETNINIVNNQIVSNIDEEKKKDPSSQQKKAGPIRSPSTEKKRQDWANNVANLIHEQKARKEALLNLVDSPNPTQHHQKSSPVTNTNSMDIQNSPQSFNGMTPNHNPMNNDENKHIGRVSMEPKQSSKTPHQTRPRRLSLMSNTPVGRNSSGGIKGSTPRRNSQSIVYH